MTRPDTITTLLLSILKTIEQPRMTACKRQHPAVYEEVLNVCPRVENAAVGHDYVRNLSNLDGTHAVSYAEDLCGTDRDCFQCVGRRQAIGTGKTGMIWQIAGLGADVACSNGEFNAGGLHLGWGLVEIIVRIVVP